MKSTVALCLLLTLSACGPLQAQTPPDLKPQSLLRVQYPLPYSNKAYRYRESPKGKMLDIQISGDHRVPITDRDTLLTPFQMLTFRNGPSNDVQLIAESPECHLDSPGHRAWDAGPIVLFTPTTNVWVQGEGFLYLETNHLLAISNNVETRVLRSLLKSTMLSGGKTNAPGTPGQVLRIFADGPALFDNQSNLVRYFNRVHIIDVQLDMTSERLSIQFTTNGAIETMLALDNVIMTTTNKGRATGPRAFYYVTNGSEMMELTGGAVWHNGDQQARAEKFLYDSTRHFLTAIGQVHIWWPNAPQRPGVVPRTNDSGFREMWADFATLQMPPTNGPVEAMHAAGNVLIVNQADQSSSTSDQADYVRTNDLFELSGSPVWRNEQMEIKGRTLTDDATNNIYHARGGSFLKLKVTGSAHTNQWLYIASEDLDYQTNLAVFYHHVQARLLEGDVLRDTLNADQLNVELFSNEVKTAIARGHAQGETAPDKFGRIKTVTCDTLTAHRSTVTKLLTEILAEGDVVLRQFGTNAAEPSNQLTAVTATAFFSAVTNQIERAVAEHDVVIDQVKTNGTIHATAERAVYTAAADEFKLTGAPVAKTDQHLISNADYLVWQPKTNRFRASGPYNITPVKAKTNNPPS
jgi:lipopolysaccharide export system protein LptA